MVAAIVHSGMQTPIFRESFRRERWVPIGRGIELLIEPREEAAERVVESSAYDRLGRLSSGCAKGASIDKVV